MSSTKKDKRILSRLWSVLRDGSSRVHIRVSSHIKPHIPITIPASNTPTPIAQIVRPVSAFDIPTMANTVSMSIDTTFQAQKANINHSVAVPSTTTILSETTSKAHIGLNGVHELLKVVKEASEMCTPLKSAVGGIVACIDAYKRASGNHDEMERLLGNIDRISSLVATRLGRYESYATRQIINDLVCVLGHERGRIQGMEGRGMFARLAQNTKDAEELVASYKAIKDALDAFQLELGLAVEHNTHDIFKNIVFQSLRRSDLAAFTAAINTNTVTRGPCTDGTRVNIVQGIFDWAVSEASTTPVYWLNGLAGTGKTTIAYTMCQRLAAAKIPFTSFFCSRQLDSRDTTLLIPTICRDLAELFQSYAAEVVPILEKDSKLARAILPLQINKLLAGPWQASLSQRNGLHTPIVIVDALDESDAGSAFLQELLRIMHEGALPGIKFLITSRADPDVVKLCASFPRGAVCHLHEVATEEVEEDITKFLLEKLPVLRGTPELGILSRRSGGLFIYAATVVRFLSSHKLRVQLSPRQQHTQLKALLDSWPIASGRTLLIDQLYEQVLMTAFADAEQTVQRELLDVLHTILCAEHPLPISVIANLVSDTGNGDVEMVSNLVDSLHATLYVSSKDGCVYWYHQSFADFVFSPDRANFFLDSTKTRLNAHCDLPVRHALLAASCFRNMHGLHFNICEIESSFLLDREVSDLEQRVSERIGETLRYASKHWASHLHRAASSHMDSLYGHARDFLHHRLLFWMEALNLMGAKSSYHPQIRFLRDWLKQVPYNDLTEYVDDISRFILHFAGSPACLSTPHLYISSLATWPRTSAVSMIWRSRFLKLPSFSHPKSSGTSLASTLLLMRSIASADDNDVMSSPHAHSVMLWDTARGEQRKQLFGHIESVTSVALSRDGTQIVSGSHDRSVRIWDVATGEQLKILDRHSKSVTSVALSQGGPGTSTYIVSGSYDKSVRIWDAVTGEELKKLVGHTDWVNSVALSHDSVHVVSGSDDHSIRVWDTVTGDQLKKLDGHTESVSSVALSQNGALIVSGSHDQSVRVWEAATGEQLKKLDGHTDWVNSVALSDDGARIASGSHDHSVRLWDTETGEQLKKLCGHTSWVMSVAISHDGAQIVSGSYDRSVRVWGAKSGKHWQLKKLYGHGQLVKCVAVSHDGSLIVSGCHNRSVRVWGSDPDMKWDVDEDGWIVCSSGRFMWISQELRNVLLHPYYILIVSHAGFAKVDLLNIKIGADWQECYTL